MKPVTDPALLAELNGGAAPGKPVSDPALLAELNKGSGDGEESWSDYVKRTDKELEGGVRHGLNRASRGIADTAEFIAGPMAKPFKMLNKYATSKGYPLSPEDKSLQYGKEFVGKSGPMANIGQMGAEAGVGALAAPVAEAQMVKGLGQMLPQATGVVKAAIPSLSQVGGNAIAGAATAPEGEKTDAAEGGAIGTVLGQTLGKGLAGGANLAKKGKDWIAQEFRPNAGAPGRALSTIERTIGKDEVGKIADQLENPPPSMLPRTSAAMAGSEKLGAMERGARSRGQADFIGHDQGVDKAAWDVIKGSTKNAEDVPGLSEQATKMFNEGQARLDKLPFSQKNREAVSKELLKLRNSNEVVGDTSGVASKQIDNMLRAVDNPETSLGVLAQLYTTVDGSVPGLGQAKAVLKRVADERSKGEFSNLLQGYGVTKDALSAAEASAALRGKFMGDTGIPVTPKYSGEAGINATPNIQSAPLRKATVGQAAGLAPDQAAQMNMLSDQLRGHEIYKSPGASAIDIGGAEGIATAGLNAGPLWRLRGTIKSAFGPINDKTTKAIDDALLDPQKFLALIEQRRATNARIPEWEAKLEKMIRTSGQTGARVGTEAATD
jgi:hypothetical protein